MVEYLVETLPFPIVVSVGISFLGAFTAIAIFEQYRICKYIQISPKWCPQEWLLGIIALLLGGVAIWTMHFVGMYSCRLHYLDGGDSLIYYRLDLTLVSLIVVILLCYAGLYIASSSDDMYMKDRAGAVVDYFKRSAEVTGWWKRGSFLFSTFTYNLFPIIAGGVCTATGVCVMHFVGMKSMIFNGHIVWNRGIVFASVVVAIIASTTAYWILFRVLVVFPQVEFIRVGSAVLAAVAVNGMHYTGMAAATFVYQPNDCRKVESNGVLTVTQNYATYGAFIAGVVVSFLALAMAISDLRMWFYSLAKITKELDSKIENYSNTKDPEKSSQQFIADYRQIRYATTRKYNTRQRSQGKFSYGSNAVIPMDEDIDHDDGKERDILDEKESMKRINESVKHNSVVIGHAASIHRACDHPVTRDGSFFTPGRQQAGDDAVPFDTTSELVDYTQLARDLLTHANVDWKRLGSNDRIPPTEPPVVTL